MKNIRADDQAQPSGFTRSGHEVLQRRVGVRRISGGAVLERDMSKAASKRIEGQGEKLERGVQI